MKLTTAIAVVTFAACAAPDMLAPPQPADATTRIGGMGAKLTANLLECPVNETTSVTSVVGALGGSINVGGTIVTIPAGALLAPVTMTVTVPASKYMEIDVSVAGVDHFVFESPVTVTLSYARCSRSNIDFAPLSVWYIDSDSKEPLEQMIGVDNKLTHTVTFTTGHLSGYAVAN